MNLRQISTVSSPVFLPCQVKIFNIFNWSSVLYIQFAVRVTCNMWLLKNYEISFFSHRSRALWWTRMLKCSFWKDGITIILIICVMIWLLQNIVTIWTSALVLIMYLHLKHPGKQKKINFDFYIHYVMFNFILYQNHYKTIFQTINIFVWFVHISNFRAKF